VSDKAYTVIGTNVVIDCGTVEEAIAYERELWANQPYAPATPAPLDVDRFMRAQVAAGLRGSAWGIAIVQKVAREYDRLAHKEK